MISIKLPISQSLSSQSLYKQVEKSFEKSKHTTPTVLDLMFKAINLNPNAIIQSKRVEMATISVTCVSFPFLKPFSQEKFNRRKLIVPYVKGHSD